MSDKFNIEKMLNSIGNDKVPAEIGDLSADIISDFGRAVEVAENSKSDKSSVVSWLSGLCYRFAAGAAFAVVVIGVYFITTSTSSIAWADVVAAMGKVDQMRAKVIVEDPRSKDEKIFTIEMFFKAPDKCRAHGRGFVKWDLHNYAPLVTQGQYLVVEDCYTDAGIFGPGEAKEWFLKHNKDFKQTDILCDRYLVGMSMEGWLIKDGT